MSGKIRFSHTHHDSQMEIPFEEFKPTEASATRQTPEFNDAESDGLLCYISLGSGSSGNSCYIGTRQNGVIIDAGLRNDYIEAQLKANGIEMRAVRGLLITHDHTDHIKYAYNLLRNNKHVKLFCTNRVLNGILRRHSISRRIKEYHVPIFKEIPFKVAGFEITAFDVPHDGTDNMGFSLRFKDHNFVLATDLGAISERAYHYMSMARYLVIESNFDLNMLVNGSYPEYLKSRIRMGSGHLDNRITAEFLAKIAGNGLEYVFLCHLSEENNTPETAVAASRTALEKAGFSVGDCSNSIAARACEMQLMALPRRQPSPLFIFR